MPNKIYRAVETAITFKDSGGDVAITLQNLGYGAGRLSDRYDRGSGSKPARYKWRAVFQFETAAVLGELVDLFIFESDGTLADGTVGTADAALTADQKRNATTQLRPVEVDTTSTATNIIASGLVEIWDRYFSLGVWNGSAGDNLENTANACSVTFTPMPDEIQ